MNRVIYSSNTVLVSTAPAATSHTGLFDLKLIDRVQSAQASFSTQVKRFKQIGFGDFLLDNFYAPPKISFNLSYYNSDTSNEAILGFDVNGESIFKNQADMSVADSVLELFRNRENIENFNKKALYILIRDRTGVKTQYITRVVNTMKNAYVEMYDNYRKTGIATINQAKFKKSEFLE